MSLGCSICSKIITGEAANCTKCETQLCRPCAELTKYRCHCGGYFKKTHIAGLMGKMFGTTGTIIIIIIVAAIYLNREDSNKNTITDSNTNNVATSQTSTKSLIEDNKTTTQTTNLDQDKPDNETQSTNTAEVNSASTVDLDQEKNTSTDTPSTDTPSTENHDEVKNTENASSAN